jgi:hypothetical protein
VTSTGLVLSSFARRYRIERSIAVAVPWIAGGMLGWGVARWFGAPDTVRLILLLALVLGGLTLAWWRDRSDRVTAHSVARHLDRRLPEMEESASLLVDSSDRSPLDALQRARVLARWNTARAAEVMPHHGLRRALLVALPLLAAGLWFARSSMPMHGSQSAWSSSGSDRVTLQRLVVQIVPPAYTGAGKRLVEARDGIDVEEGATVTWQLQSAGAVREAWLLPSSGDSTPFVMAGDGAWTLVTRAERSHLVRVRLAAGDSLSLLSDDYRFAVRPDKPPALTVIAPAERTVIAPGKIGRIPVTIRALDDYGVDQVTMNATVASGRGEAVRFRRLQLPLGTRSKDPQGGEKIGGVIDLPALKMGPGDELYFYIEATDRRAPIPNRARSETVFISLEDTSAVPTADLARLALNAQPEYFRSQRQLIIDTEKLLKEQPRITVTQFRDRANDIGIDQGLLRLRYGQFLGEEFEEQAAEMGGREHAAAEAGGEAQKQLEATEGGKSQTTEQAREEAKGELQHKHDDAENATLLGLRAKGMLRTAVGAMWQAELHLRTAEPKRALPYMNQALELIKAIQQDARVYVQRVGFEPPPIEIDKLRLSGKLAGITDRRVGGTTHTRDSLPATQRALELLEGASRDSLVPALQAAGNELADIAIQDPRLLPVLKSVRDLIDSTARGVRCHVCERKVRQGLWTALPEPEPRTGFGTLAPSPLGRRWGELMRGTRPETQRGKR